MNLRGTISLKTCVQRLVCTISGEPWSGKCHVQDPQPQCQGVRAYVGCGVKVKGVQA